VPLACRLNGASSSPSRRGGGPEQSDNAACDLRSRHLVRRQLADPTPWCGSSKPSASKTSCLAAAMMRDARWSRYRLSPQAEHGEPKPIGRTLSSSKDWVMPCRSLAGAQRTVQVGGKPGSRNGCSHRGRADPSPAVYVNRWSWYSVPDGRKPRAARRRWRRLIRVVGMRGRPVRPVLRVLRHGG
jgi:hypothetical protein